MVKRKPGYWGVYWIRCLVTGRVYIGSSMDVANRLDTPRKLLNKGTHHSTKLQNAWTKYGEASFDMELIDPVYCLEDLRDSEIHYIELYDSYKNGYNSTDCVKQGQSIPLAVRAKMSVAAKQLGADPELRRQRSERAKAQHAAGNLGQSTWKPGTARAVGAKLRGRLRPDVTESMKGNKFASKKV